jgi:hypothetical protein
MLSENESLPFEVDDENNITLANGAVFLAIATNRSSFLLTLIIEPPLLLISYYFALKSEVKYMIDPENGQRFDVDQQIEYV